MDHNLLMNNNKVRNKGDCPLFCSSLAEAAVAVLRTADPGGKVRLSRDFAAAWASGEIAAVGTAEPPARPARPERPELRPPREMPRRRTGKSLAGRQALYHALAHIELNAIDLAWDIIARFTTPQFSAENPPRGFYDDWVRVADDEARHFALLNERLTALDTAYGALPAHDGLWQAAEATAHDLLARLAVVPLVLEARGLDVTPGLIAKLEAAGDEAGAAALGVIYRDEIGHVAAGKRWFDWLCARRGLPPAATWRELVARHFKGAVKPPFNSEARLAAGLQADFYEAAVAAPEASRDRNRDRQG
jgi:uncharacterized ferritin-like protein (DUF455 family)